LAINLRNPFFEICLTVSEQRALQLAWLDPALYLEVETTITGSGFFMITKIISLLQLTGAAASSSAILNVFNNGGKSSESTWERKGFLYFDRMKQK
jgi:hypothetical protein